MERMHHRAVDAPVGDDPHDESEGKQGQAFESHFDSA
jgi:hypothetical protein